MDMRQQFIKIHMYFIMYICDLIWENESEVTFWGNVVIIRS